MIIIGVLVIVGYYVLIPYYKIGGKFDNNYNGQDLQDNFNKKQSELFELRDYFLQILPEEKGVSFGFDNRTDRFYFIIREIQKDGNIEFMSGENLKIDDNETRNLLKRIDWKDDELNILIENLKAANCIGIFKQPYGKSPVQISFREGGTYGLAKYSYYLFSEPLNDSLIKKWNKKEGFVMQNDTVFFEYGYPL